MREFLLSRVGSLSKSLRPLPCSVIHRQDPNDLITDSVGHNEWRVRDGKFPRSGDTTTASRSRMFAEHLGNIDNALRNFFCCPRITVRDVVVGLLQLLRSRNSPSDFHLLRRARANFVILALTSVVSMVRPSLTALSPSLIKLA